MRGRCESKNSKLREIAEENERFRRTTKSNVLTRYGLKNVRGVFESYNNVSECSVFQIIMKTTTDEELRRTSSLSPEGRLVAHYKKSLEQGKGLEICPGTPISDLSVSEIPSPRGGCANENAFLLPFYNPVQQKETAKKKPLPSRQVRKIMLKWCVARSWQSVERAK